MNPVDSLARWLGTQTGSVGRRYGAAVLFATMSLVLTLLLREVINPSLFILIFVAVTASAAYGGFGPAALASLLSVVGADLLLIGPIGSPNFDDPGNFVRLAALLAGAAITSLINVGLRQASARAERAAAASRLAEENAKSLTRALEAQAFETRKNETRLQLAIESAHMVAWQWDPSTDLVTTSANLRDVYGVDSFAGSSSGFDLLHPEDRPRHQATVLAAVQEQRAYHSQFRIVRPDTGATVWLEERGAPVVDSAGEVVRLVGVSSDITPQREAALERERLLEAERSAHQLAEAKATELEKLSLELRVTNRDLDQFAYVASHDLKAPLRGIANLTQWLEEDLGELVTATAEDHMRLLKSRVHRMESLIDGILTYSRAGRTRGQVEDVDVQTLIEETIELLALPDTATVALPGQLPIVKAIPIQFEQVVLNLIGNAVKHAGGTPVLVEILWRDLGDHHEFGVRDDGPGIAKEYLERIWGLFQTLEARDKVEGAGIGLAVVRRTVESAGGAVSVVSEAGRGSTFYFTWPKTPVTKVPAAGGSWKTES